MESREETNPYIADLTKNVITQEFTNCSIKAVRLADRIKEWHDKQTKPLKDEIADLKKKLSVEEQQNEMLIEELNILKDEQSLLTKELNIINSKNEIMNIRNLELQSRIDELQKGINDAIESINEFQDGGCSKNIKDAKHFLQLTNLKQTK